MFEIIPGILEQEWAKIEEKLEKVLPFAKTIHIDLLDGKLVGNTTFADPTPFQKYTSHVTFELHMMVENPLLLVEKWANAGFKRFLGHIEKMPDQVAFVATAQKFGEVGLAVDGPTDLAAITVPYEDLDVVMFYTSERIGFSGPPFNPQRLEKVKMLREKASFLPIEVDGGVNDKTIILAQKRGATRFVTTSYIFGNENPAEAFQQLHHCLGSEV